MAPRKSKKRDESYLDKLPAEVLDLIVRELLLDWQPPILPGTEEPALQLTAHCHSHLLFYDEADIPSICRKKSFYHLLAMSQAFLLHPTTVLLYGFDSDSLSHLIREMDHYARCSSLKNASIYFWNCNADLTLPNLVRWAFLLYRFRHRLGSRILFGPQFCGERHDHRRQEKALLQEIAMLVRECDMKTERAVFARDLQALILLKKFPKESEKYKHLAEEANDRDMPERFEMYWLRCAFDAPRKGARRCGEGRCRYYGKTWDLHCEGKTSEARCRPRPCTRQCSDD